MYRHNKFDFFFRKKEEQISKERKKERERKRETEKERYSERADKIQNHTLLLNAYPENLWGTL